MVKIIAQTQDDGAALKLFVFGLRRALTGTEESFFAPSDAVMRRAVQMATRAKLLPVFVDGIRQYLDPVQRDQLDEASRAFKLFTFKTNGPMLKHIGAASEILSDAKIAHVVYKGPLQQQQTHGHLFHRPSMDIDMLVGREDFITAATALKSAGFEARQNLSLWWRVFVGQDHFTKNGFSGWSIDLHHRLQEPGVQQPRSSEAFLERPEHTKLDQLTVPLIRKDLVPLVATLNFVKCLSRRRDTLADVGHKMSAAHLIDLHHLLAAGDPVLLDAFIVRAERHRLKGSAVLALRGLQAVLGTALGAHQSTVDKCLEGIDDTHLAAMILAPEMVRNWPSPRGILAQSWPAQPASFVRDFGWYLESEAVRKTYRAGRLLGVFAKPARDLADG